MISNHTKNSHRHDELEQSIQLLAQVEPTHSPLVSCYLDMRQGAHAARRYLAAERKEILKDLSGFERFEFDQCCENIMNDLDSHKYECDGLVFFSRSYQGGHFFQTLKLDLAPENRILVSDVPDIVPLMLLVHEHARFIQASVSNDAIELIEVSMGNDTLLGMAPLPETSSEESRIAIATHLLERTMRSSPRREVIVDGDETFIHAIYHALPRLLRRRIIQLIPRKHDDTDKKIRRVGNLMHKRYREHVSRDRFNDILKSGHAMEYLTTGITGCLDAIKSRHVSVLYLAAHDLDLGACSTRSGAYEHTLLDVVRLAIQQSIPIEFTASSRLMHQAGGVACLISQKAPMQRPVSLSRQDSLGMVA